MVGLESPIDWAAIPHPPFLRGDAYVANRDPAGHYHDGLFRVFHTRRGCMPNRAGFTTPSLPSRKAGISSTGANRSY